MDARECTIRLLVKRKGQSSIRIVATTGISFIGVEEVPLEESQIDHDVLSGNVVCIEDVRNDVRFRWQEEARQAGIVSMICAPLVARRRIIGTIRLYTAERREFSVAERKILLAVAGQAASAIEKAQLYKQIETKNRELSVSNEALRTTQKELVKKERLAALGEMAATVAHEIRNPLTSIRGFAQRVARLGAQGKLERIDDYAQIIMEEVDRLNKFIKDVLDFARRAKPTFERTSINAILSELVNLTSSQMTARKIIVLADLDMDLRETFADRALVKQMFLNILQNARQALPDGGMITIKTQNQGKAIRIRIADNGPGIPHDTIHRIWTPFFSTKTHGTGLGLALVQRIVDDHHGRIVARSRRECGTIFDIHFPVVRSEDEILQREMPRTA
jgi:signal transduction histidine kinase